MECWTDPVGDKAKIDVRDIGMEKRSNNKENPLKEKAIIACFPARKLSDQCRGGHPTTPFWIFSPNQRVLKQQINTAETKQKHP